MLQAIAEESGMFAADAAFEAALCRAPLCDGHLNELADPRGVERLEWVAREQLRLQIIGQKRVHVVATEAERHLRQVVCAEAEEVGVLGNFVGC